MPQRVMPEPGWRVAQDVPLAEWRALFEDSPLAIAYVSPDRRLMRANGEFAMLCQRMAGELLGRPCCEVLGERPPGAEEGAAGSSCSFCWVEECMRTGVAQRFEQPLRDRLISVVASPMRDRSGGVLGAVLMITDTTTERALQRQLLDLHRLATIGMMTASVAHELKNPLTGIAGFVQLLHRRTDLPDDARAQIGLVHNEARRCVKIVSSLLRFARQKAEGKALVDLNHVVREALDFQRYQLVANGVQVHEDYFPSELPVVADRCQIHQVVQNIVSNALDAILEVRRGGNLFARTLREGGRVVMEFENDGPPLTEPEKIFLPFHTTKPAGKGTGLGLSICHRIMQDHRGLIHAANTLGGVIFRVAFPHPSGDEVASGGTAGGKGSVTRPRAEVGGVGTSEPRPSGSGSPGGLAAP